MNTSCEIYRGQMAQALMGELAPQPLKDWEEHLAQCPACAEEKKLYQATFAKLKQVSDVPVPQHFFVYPEERTSSPWQLFLQLSFAWRSAVAAAILLILGLGVLASLQARVSAGNGGVTVSFGKTLPVTVPIAPANPVDVAAIKKEILASMEEKSRADRLQVVQLLRTELAKSHNRFNQRQRELLQTSLDAMETRLNGRIVAAGALLEARSNQNLTNYYKTLQTERQQDLAHISTSLTRIVQQGTLKNRQTDAILDTLLQVAELKMVQSPVSPGAEQR
jgi:hypothetical protein